MVETSIVIRCKNEEKFVGRVLEKVFEQEYNDSFEVVVIDSGSTDKTSDIVNTFPVRLYHIKPNKFTFGHALNYGAALAKGKYVVYLSAHCIPIDKNWLYNLTSPIDTERDVVATYGRQEPIKGINPLEEHGILKTFPSQSDKAPMAIFSNSNACIEKTILKKFPFAEDIKSAEDFLWRKLLPSKYKVLYISDASVYHSHPLSFRYWAKRFHGDGECVSDMEHAHKIEYPWGSTNDTFTKLLRMSIGSAIVNFNYLIKNRYYVFLPHIFLFEFMRIYFYRRGLKTGMKNNVTR